MNSVVGRVALQLVAIAGLVVTTSSAFGTSPRQDPLTAMSRGSRLVLSSEMIVPANAQSVALVTVHSRQWANRRGLVSCVLNVQEASVDSRRIGVGREIEFSGVILNQGDVTSASEPEAAYVVELEVVRPSAIRSLACSGSFYKSFEHGWTPMMPLIADLEDSFAPYGTLMSASPVDLPDSCQ